MPKLNEHYQDLKESYLFAEIAHRVAAYEAEHPDAKIIRLGIGDVTLPLGELAVKGLHEGVDAMVPLRPSRVTARSRATHFCAMPSPLTMHATAYPWMRLISLSPMAQRAIPAIFPNYLTTTT